MSLYLHNGQELVGAFTLDGIQHPANWLECSTREEREAIGIGERIDVCPPLTGAQKYGDYTEETVGMVTTRTYAAIPKTEEEMAAIRADMWLLIKGERDRRKSGGAQVGDYWFHSDADSRIQQLGLVMMGASIPSGLQWKTMSGAFVTMTAMLAGQIFQAVATLDQALFANAEQHRAAMEASADPAAYYFSTGWAPAYGEA